MILYVYPYHGRCDKLLKTLKDRLGDKFLVVDDATWIYKGSIQEFSDEWGDRFMYIPKEYTVMVTQHTNFGQR